MSLFKQIKDRFEFDCNTDVMAIGPIWDRIGETIVIVIGPLIIEFDYSKAVDDV